MNHGVALLKTIRFIIQICRGVIRDNQVRRTLMFYTTVGVMLQLFFGATFLWNWLRAHPLVFLGYWAACGWFTMLAALLAIYDLIRVRAAGRDAEKELREKCLRGDQPNAKHDTDED